MEPREQFISDLDNVAREVGAQGLVTFVRLLAIGVQQQTSLLRISDRWLMRDLDMNQHAVTAAKRSISRVVHIDSSHGRTTTYLLPLPYPAQPCLFPAQAGDFHISTTAPDISTAAPLPVQVHTGIPASSAPLPASSAPLPAQVHTGIPASSAPLPAQVQHGRTSSAVLPAQDTRAQDDRNRIEGLVVTHGLFDRVVEIARCRSINPSMMAEAEAVRARLTAYLRSNAEHPNTIQKADNTITAQVLAIGHYGRVLRELEKLETEKHSVQDSYGYLVVVLINRILGVDRHTIRRAFDLVKHERASRRGGQLTLDNYGINADSLGRKLA